MESPVPTAIAAASRDRPQRFSPAVFVSVAGNALELRQDLKVLAAGMSVERYLNHPTFGMLYRVCPVAAGEEIHATLYAQRMFFRVTSQPQGTSFEAMPFSDARHQAEQNLLRLRRNQSPELPLWKKLFDQTFI